MSLATIHRGCAFSSLTQTLWEQVRGWELASRSPKAAADIRDRRPTTKGESERWSECALGARLPSCGRRSGGWIITRGYTDLPSDFVGTRQGQRVELACAIIGEYFDTQESTGPLCC